jgi:formate dehydrogenase subunit delta
MANEIARNLRAQAGDQAGNATAAHMRSFWTPGMRAELIAHASAGCEGLEPIVLEAARLLDAAALP